MRKHLWPWTTPVSTCRYLSVPGASADGETGQCLSESMSIAVALELVFLFELVRRCFRYIYLNFPLPTIMEVDTGLPQSASLPKPSYRYSRGTFPILSSRKPPETQVEHGSGFWKERWLKRIDKESTPRTLFLHQGPVQQSKQKSNHEAIGNLVR